MQLQSDSSPQLDIHQDFYPFESVVPFKCCTECECELLDSNKEYLVERAIKQSNGFKDVLFEYALCMSCAEKMNAEISDESKQQIQQFFQESMEDMVLYVPLDDLAQHVERQLSRCMLSKRDRDECNEYQLCGKFKGDKMEVSVFPYLMSSNALEPLQKRISKETKDKFDDFIDNHFGLPPEWKEAIKRKGPVAV